MHDYYITGTSRGIGNALTRALLEQDGNRVKGIGRTAAAAHPRYIHCFLDLTDLDAVKEFAFDIPADTCRVVLVNNAGAVAPVAPLGRLESRAVVEAFHLNLISPVILMNTFLAQTRGFGGEKIIVNVSSGAGRHPVDSWSVYCSAKAGLDMAGQVAAKEQVIYNPDNPVSVFSIAPGVVDTQMQAELRSVPKADFNGVDRFIELHQSGGLTAPEAAARGVIRIIENRDEYRRVRLDLRDL